MSSKAGRIGKAALSPYNKAVPGVRGQCGVPFGPSRIHIANRWALSENYICKHFIKVGAEWASGESGLLPVWQALTLPTTRHPVVAWHSGMVLQVVAQKSWHSGKQQQLMEPITEAKDWPSAETYRESTLFLSNVKPSSFFLMFGCNLKRCRLSP